MNNKTFKFIVIAIFASLYVMFISGFNSFLEAAEQSQRPKIGLVLSGGGARGSAHIGVLKVLEENHVPIDYIAGTSMGAVVGGLYASGMSPEEIEENIVAIDWKDLFTDRPFEQDLPFRRKGEQRRLIDFEMGFKKGRLVFPKGLVAGQKLGFLLKSMTLQVTGIKDFDLLPIPFRAMAADIETGELVVLDHGNLAEAIRASMSVPGMFSPVENNDRILVDGGIVKNLPIDVAMQMGADVIIAVDVGMPLFKRDKLESAVDVTMQVIGIMTLQNVKEQIALLREKDLLIIPDLENSSTSDFSKSSEIIRLGEEVASELAEEIKSYSVTTDEYKIFLARHRQHDIKSVKVDFVKVKSSGRVTAQAIKKRIKTKAGGTLDRDVIQGDLTRIYAIGDFEQVDFGIIEEDEKKGLLINAKEKAWGPDYVRFGLNITDDFRGDSFYNLLLNYRKSQVNVLGAEWKNEIQIGRTRSVFTEFYQPLDYAERFFIAPRLKYERRVEDVYSGYVRDSQYRVRSFGGGIDAGINFGTFAEARVGIERGDVSAGPLIGGGSLPNFEIDWAAFVGSLEFDQIDNSNFPRYGIYASINAFLSRKDLGADESYDKLIFSVTKATTCNKHTFLTSLIGGTGIDDDIPFYDELTMGGFLNLSGYRKGELRGQHTGLGRLIYYYELAELHGGFIDNIYIGGSLEAGNAWSKRSDVDIDDLLFGGGVFIGVDTILGPLYLGYGHTEGNKEDQVYLFLGQTF